jgi:hypothetical protein
LEGLQQQLFISRQSVPFLPENQFDLVGLIIVSDLVVWLLDFNQP